MTARSRQLAADGVTAVLAGVARRRAEGREVLALHVGEPDFATPSNVLDAAVAAIRAGRTRYTPVLGIPELRKAVARSAGAARGIDVDPGRVVVTPGAKMALHLAVLALCEPGDEVVCTDPAYGAYAALGRVAGVTVRTVSQRIEDGFRLDLEALDAAVGEQTRILFLNSPCNPTGHVLDHGEVSGVARVLARHPRLTLVSDEIYGRIVYESAWSSPAGLDSIADRTVIVDGFSKTYAMTGWRVGYAILPAALSDAYAQLALHTFLCVNEVAQWAALEAITGPQDAVAEMVSTYRRRRDLMCDGLDRIAGLRAVRPDGAFYVFVDARSFDIDSVELSLHLLSTAGVATYPGSAFGAAGNGFIRLSFAASDDAIRTALERIEDATSRLHRTTSAGARVLL